MPGTLDATTTRIAHRRERKREIVACTRSLFDERGSQDVSMDEIARAVKINRALIYRCFESKEELFVLAITEYLDEITVRGLDRIDREGPLDLQLEQSWASFCDYCLEYPAFPDCALSLMRRPAEELQARLSASTWIRLGESMSACLGVTTEILRDGMTQGLFAIEDPDFVVSCLYTQTLGMMHLARVGVGVARARAGTPEPFAIDASRVRGACITAALAAVGLGPSRRHAAAGRNRR